MPAEILLTPEAPDARSRLEIDRSTWKSLVQFLPHAVLLLDARLRIVIANRAASLMFRTPAANMTGRPIVSIIPELHLDHWLLQFGAERTKVIEIPIELSDSGTGRITLQIVAVRLVRARVQYRLLVLEDITRRATLEEQLVQSEKQAAMGQLAAGILHEIANPLAGLGSQLVFARGGLERLGRDDLMHALDISLEQLDQMRQLLGTLSGFPGHAAPALERADLLDIVRRAIAFVRRDAERRQVRFDLSFACSAISCDIDVRLIRQVLLNVLKNAMEAMPHGGRVDIRAYIRGEEHGIAPTARLEVADTGIGIVEADLRKVFRPLFSTKPRGAGLGLSFCRQTIEEHGGQIRLSSRGLHTGTLVTITLPLRSCAIDES